MRNTFISNDISRKVSIALISHVYLQTTVAMLASLFCASIVFIGLYSGHEKNSALYIWSGFYLAVTLFRIGLTVIYKHQSHPDFYMRLWQIAYIIGALLGGFSWGLSGIILYPYASDTQQTLLILMLAGVTAGAVPLSSGIPSAAIAFLIFAVVPYISIIATSNTIFLIFDFALTLYLIYTIILSIKGYKLIKNSLQLRFENDALLVNLSDAKKTLEVTNEKLEQTATHDPLTGAANRILFQSNLINAINRAKRDHKIFALFFIDLDHFKPVNDIYGHQVGDQLLIATFEKLKNYFGADKTIGRLGGDEFTAIVENIKNLKEITAITKEICNLMSSPITINDINIKISGSIGVSIYPTDGDNLDTLLRQADEAMYRAKQQGGNRLCFSKRLIAEGDTERA